MNSWKKCGISNALDSIKDYGLFEESESLNDNSSNDESTSSEGDLMEFCDQYKLCTTPILCWVSIYKSEHS